jgi:hypothetical protein
MQSTSPEERQHPASGLAVRARSALRNEGYAGAGMDAVPDAPVVGLQRSQADL